MALKFYVPKLPSTSWPLGYNRACDHVHMMPDNTIHDLSLVPMLGSQRVLGRVPFLVLLYNSNSLSRQGIGASCISKMQSCFCLAFHWEEICPSKYSWWSTGWSCYPSSSLWNELCKVATTSIGWSFVNIGVYTTHVDRLGSSYPSVWYHVKNQVSLCSRRSVCVCVWEREREREREREHKYTKN